MPESCTHEDRKNHWEECLQIIISLRGELFSAKAGDQKGQTISS